MNPVSEQDLEQLENYLDGALPPEESKRLDTRLAEEPDLAVALEELGVQRATRAVAWAMLEPTEAAAGGFAERVIATARRQERQSRLWRAGRFGSAAAACVLLGIFMGWLGRDRGTVPFPVGGPVVNSGVDVIVGPPARPEPLGVVVREVQFPDPSGPPRPVLVVSEVTKAPTSGAPGLHKGDLLISIDGQRVTSVAALSAVLASGRGMRVLRILRDGQVHEVAIRFEKP